MHTRTSSYKPKQTRESSQGAHSPLLRTWGLKVPLNARFSESGKKPFQPGYHTQNKHRHFLKGRVPVRQRGSDPLPNDGAGTSGSGETLPEKPGASTSEYQRLFPKPHLSASQTLLRNGHHRQFDSLPSGVWKPLVAQSQWTLAPTGPKAFFWERSKIRSFHG